MRGIKIIAIGSDPEIFLKKKGKALSAIGLIGGSKEEPVEISKEGHKLQEDNVMVEFNIPPVRDVKRWKKELKFCLNYIDNLVGNDIEIVVTPSLEFDEEQLSHINAKQFGCSPDNNVWKQMPNPEIKAPKSFRFAGGHIHVSYEDLEESVTENIVKSMDLFLGVPSVLLDKDEERKKVYGTAGRFRFTSYGLEYRSLSNFWLSSEDLMEWAFLNTIKAINYASKNVIFDELGN